MAARGTVGDRREQGRAARKEVPRSALGAFEPAAKRPDPITMLVSQGATRIQNLLPVRYGRMSESAFSFYRGAALVMASDLSAAPRTSLRVQLCGDAHLSNFGAYASPERRLVFDVNDFDETNPGPFEWDVKRLSTSFEIASRQNGFSDANRETIVLTSSVAYRVTMARLAGLGDLDAWYDHIDVDSVADLLRSRTGKKASKDARKMDKFLARARRHNSLQALQKLTEVKNGHRRIVSSPPLIVPIDDLMHGAERDDVISEVRSRLSTYARSLQSDRRHLLSGFDLVDLAHKVVGVGSVGTRSWILLMAGRDDDDPLFLQFKEAGPSVLEQFTERSRYKNMGARVVAGQRIMQSTSDIFLGWTGSVDLEGQTRDYYFRQLRDWKISAAVEELNVEQMVTYAKLCGATLAKAHARSGDRIAVASYLGIDDPADRPNTFDRAMANFAVSYAEQNEQDFTALKTAIADGSVAATPGV